MEDSKQCRGAGAQDKRSHRHPERRGEARFDRTWRISAGGSGRPAQSPDEVAFLPAIRNLASGATAIECHFLLPGDAVSLLIRELIETLSGDAKQHGGTISQVKLRGMDKDRLCSRSRPRSFDWRTSRSIIGVFATKLRLAHAGIAN